MSRDDELKQGVLTDSWHGCYFLEVLYGLLRLYLHHNDYLVIRIGHITLRRFIPIVRVELRAGLALRANDEHTTWLV